MKTYAIPAGTPLHCNRNQCGATFPAPAGLERWGFAGDQGTRTTTLVHCPSCHTTDGHWVYASDIEKPTFTGNFDARKAAERQWLRDN
jgi:hypothetical protein